MLLVPGQELELHREFHEDGSPRSEARMRRAEDGSLVLEGRFESWHPGGKRASSGQHRDGERHGKWIFWHPEGPLKARGGYDHGLRNGPWEVRLPDGSEDPAESGTYAVGEERYAELEGAPLRTRGELRDGVPHGAWTFLWPDGTAMARGELRDGRPHGPWRFHHADGSPEPGWISGTYDHGVRAGEVSADAPEDAPEPDPRRAQLRLDPRLTDAQREQARRDVALVLDEQDEAARRSAAERLQWLGLSSVPFAVAALRELDPAVPGHLARGARLEKEVLEPLAADVGFGWAAAARAGRLDDARRALLRWHAFGEVGACDPEFEHLELRLARKTRQAGQPCLPTLAPGNRDGRQLLVPTARAAFEPRFGERADEVWSGALDDSLAWLAAHQSPDGGWGAAGFAQSCAGEAACGGPGAADCDVGVTGLALLALLGGGSTTRSGPHAEAVVRGVAWLVERQDRRTGRIETRLDERTVLRGAVSVYGHAIATLALCEAACTSTSPALRAAAEKAALYAVAIRNPYSAWRYDEPPAGKSDTSITAWMVQALESARLAGFDMPAPAFEGAISWVDEVTDPATGRVGYDAPGSLSARVEGVNDHFPRDKAEALTGAALYCRFLAGQSPGAAPIMVKHSDLVLRRVPEWDPDGFGCDMYAWFYGSQALHQVGGKQWMSWSKALGHAVLASQRKDGCHAGSWDPVGPWGAFGGRVYATAMVALSLEAPTRRARIQPPAEPRSRR